MDKIIYKEYREYLIKDNMYKCITEEAQKKVFKNINKEFKEILKMETIKKLQTVISLLESNSYKALKELLAESPSGDDMGCDNTYICFYPQYRAYEDIGKIVDRLSTTDEEDYKFYKDNEICR